MDVLSTEQTFYELNYASSNVVYISLPDSSSTCGSWLSELPSLPSGWSYHCSATPTNIDGTGWIPIPFSNFPILNISQLFIDPLNKPPYYYSFVVGGSYEVTAALEADSNKGPDAIGGKDGGDHNFVYEAGTNKKLTPSSVQARVEPDSLKQGLVGWWTFDEGIGTTTRDLSGFGNNGTLLDASSTNADGNTPPQWTAGKVGGALSFDGVDDYVSIAPFSQWDTPQLTIFLYVNGDFLWSDQPFYWTSGYWTNGFVAIRNTRAGEYGCPENYLGLIIYQGNSQTGQCSYLIRNTWIAYTITYDDISKTGKIYRNGQLIKTFNYGPATIVRGSAKPLYISGGGGGGFFKGVIDEVRLYNRALSDAEIKALYDATK
jgi:hypothetical protein